MKKLFLDDIRKPYDSSWDLVKSYQQFVSYIETNGCPDVISFDHDLAWDHYPLNEDPKTYQTVEDARRIEYDKYTEKTGWHAAKWLLDNGYKPSAVVVHSMNSVGAKNIANLFEGKVDLICVRVYDPMNPIKISLG